MKILNSSLQTKKRIQKIALVVFLNLVFSISTFAQAPTISYTPSTIKCYNQTPIAPVVPRYTGTIPTLPRTVATYAGKPGVVSADPSDHIGLATEVCLQLPRDLVFDKYGNLFVVDEWGLKKITTDRQVSFCLKWDEASNILSSVSGFSGERRSSGNINSLSADNLGNVYFSSDALIFKMDPSMTITLFAGTGYQGSADGNALSATFGANLKIAIDKQGVMYVADIANHKIRKISTSGIVSTLAGQSSAGHVDGTINTAKFDKITSLAVDDNSNVYVTEYSDNPNINFYTTIRKVSPNGTVSTWTGNGVREVIDSNGLSASFGAPNRLVYSNEAIYLSDSGCIRKITLNGDVTTLTGGDANYGEGFNKKISSISGIAVDADGDIYVSEQSMYAIRKIQRHAYYISPALPKGIYIDSKTGVITGTIKTTYLVGTTSNYTVTAINENFSGTTNVTLDFAKMNHYIHFDPIPHTPKVNNQINYLYIPLSASANSNIPLDFVGDHFTGDVTSATFYVQNILDVNYSGLRLNSGTLVVTASVNCNNYWAGQFYKDALPAMRVATFGVSKPNISYPQSLTFRPGVHVSLVPTNTGGEIPAISDNEPSIKDEIGTGYASDQDGINPVFIKQPHSVVSDVYGNVYFSDYGNNKIKKYNVVTKEVSTYVTGVSFPMGMAIDPSGYIYVADAGNDCIRRISPTSNPNVGSSTVFAGIPGSYGNVDGSITQAKFRVPVAVAVDADYNVYVADRGNNAVRRITFEGEVSTIRQNLENVSGIAVDNSGNVYVSLSGPSHKILVMDKNGNELKSIGTGTAGFKDGFESEAQFNSPMGLSFDMHGNLFVADRDNNRIRKITPDGLVTTFAGNGESSIYPSGEFLVASFNHPTDVAIDPYGAAYVADKDYNLIRKMPTFVYTIYPPVPAGITFNARTGAISGTNTSGTTTTHIVTATNIAGAGYVKKAQGIPDFEEKLQDLVYGDNPIVLDVNASSGLPITYTSDNPAVVRILNNTLVIVSAGTCNITATQSGDAIYAPTGYTISIEVKPKPLTIKAVYEKKIYNGDKVSTATPILVGNNLVAGDYVASPGIQVFEKKDAGAVLLLPSGIVIKKGNVDVTSSYAISYKEELGEITPLLLEITKPDLVLSKVYDGTTIALIDKLGTISNKISGDDVSISWTANYNNPIAATGKTIRVSYQLTGNNADNYSPPVDYTHEDGIIWAAGGIKLTYTEPSITLSKVYDGDRQATITNDGVLGGKVDADNITVKRVALYEDANAGENKMIEVVSVLTGPDAYKYAPPVSYVTYNGIITRKQLTVSDTYIIPSKVYDGNLDAAVGRVGNLHGVVSTDRDKVNVLATGLYKDAITGKDKPITAYYILKGENSGNYAAPLKEVKTNDGVIWEAGTNILAFSVSPQVIDKNKTYNGNVLTDVGQGTLAGFDPGDDVAVTTIASYADANVGQGKTITLKCILTGADAAKYKVPTLNDITDASITARQLTISNTKVKNTKIFDNNTSTSIDRIGNLWSIVPGDVVTVSGEANYDSKEIGTNKKITVTYALDGNSRANYIKPKDDDNFIGKIVDKYKQDIQIGNYPTGLITYGDPSFTLSVNSNTGASPTFSSSDAGVLAVNANTGGVTIVGVGSVSITVTVDGNDSYKKTTKTIDLTVAPRQLEIGNPDLTISKIYDGTSIALINTLGTISKNIQGDDIAVVGAASYNDATVGSGKTITVSYRLTGNKAENYLAPVDYTNNEGSIIAAGSIQLTIGDPSIELTKEYNGGREAIIKTVGILGDSKIASDNITVTPKVLYEDANAGENKMVVVTYVLTGPDAYKYIPPVSYVKYEGIITRKPLTISNTYIISSKVYDGNSDAAVGRVGNLHGIASTDRNKVNSLTIAYYDDASVGTGKTIRAYYILKGESSGNYEITQSEVKTNDGIIWDAIGTKALNFSIPPQLVDKNKTYDGNFLADVSQGTLAGFDQGDDVSVTTIASYANKKAEPRKTITLKCILTGEDAAKYKVPILDDITDASITARQLKINNTQVQNSKIVDGNNSALVIRKGNLWSIVPRDFVLLEVGATYNGVEVGDHEINVTYSLVGDDRNNYIKPEDEKFAGVIRNKTTQDIDITNPITGDITYGDPAFKIVASSISIPATTPIFTSSDPKVMTVDDKGEVKIVGVGSATITITIPGNNIYADAVRTFDYFVNRRQLQIGAPVLIANKVYDGTTIARIVSIGSLTNYVGNDNTDLGVVASANYDTKDVGNGKLITLAYRLTGKKADCYFAPMNDVQPGGVISNIGTIQLTMTKKPDVELTKKYDGGREANINDYGILSGTVSSNDVTVTPLAFYEDANAGTKKMIVVTYVLTGTDATKYIPPKSEVTYDGTISRKQLEVSNTNVVTAKVFDNTVFALVKSPGNFWGVASTDYSLLTPFATGAYNTPEVGDGKLITIKYGLNGTASANYIAPDDANKSNGSILSASGLTQLTMKVPAVPTIAKPYDGNAIAQIPNTYSLNTPAGQDVTVSAIAMYDDSKANPSKTITVHYLLSGADATKYKAPESHITSGKIDPRPLTVSNTLVTTTKPFDGNNVAAVVRKGNIQTVVPGDNVTLKVESATFNDAVRGQNKTITVVYSLESADAANYSKPENDTYTGTILDKMAQTITFSPATIETKTYGDASFDLSAQATSGNTVTITSETPKVVSYSEGKVNIVGAGDAILKATVTGNDTYAVAEKTIPFKVNQKELQLKNVKVSGREYNGTTQVAITHDGLTDRINNDVVTLKEGTANIADKNAGTNRSVTLVGYSLEKADAWKYSLTPPGDLTATITARKITITADAKSKIYGDVDPTLTAKVTTGEIATGDAPEGSLSRVVGETVDKYIINQGEYKFGSNYEETYIAAIFEITRRPIVVNAVYDTKHPDGTTNSDKTPTFDVKTLATGDAVLEAPKQKFSGTELGTYTLTPYGLKIKNAAGDDVTSNYDIDYRELIDGGVISNNTLQTITIDDSQVPSSITYGDKPFVISASASSGLAVTYSSSDTNVATIDPTTGLVTIVGAGPVIITISQAGDNTYAPISITYSFTVEGKKLKIYDTFVTPTKPWDGNTTAIATPGFLTGVLKGDVVTPLATAVYDNANIGSDKTITVTYSLDGASASKYLAPDGFSIDYGIIYDPNVILLPIELNGETYVNPSKPYDGTRSATVIETGSFTGVSENDMVTLHANATYDNPNVGVGKDIVISYYLKGKDAYKYKAPDNVINRNGVITAISVSAAKPSIINSKRTYDGTVKAEAKAGEALGCLEKDIYNLILLPVAKYLDKNVGTRKTIEVTYQLDGEAKANYVFTPTDYKYSEDIGEITAIQLKVKNTAVDVVKMYSLDNKTANVSYAGDLKNLIVNENVTLNAGAFYANDEVGENKTITVKYWLTVDDVSRNYLAPVDSIITNGEIMDKIVFTVNPITTQACEGSELNLTYTPVKGKPVKYKIDFTSDAITDVDFIALPSTGNTISFVLPEGLKYGEYTGKITMRNVINDDSEPVDFTFKVNVSNDLILTKYGNVVFVDNSSKQFAAYQWYKDEVLIPNATKQYYQDLNGLDGEYKVELTTVGGEKLFSCPKRFNQTLSANVKAYPNPVNKLQPVTIITVGLSEKELENASMTIYNAQGVSVYTTTKVEKRNSIPQLPGGINLVRITTADGNDYSCKIVVVE